MVLKDLWHLYAKRPRIWLGIASEFIASICVRIIVVILVAKLSAYIVAQDQQAALRTILLILITSIGGAVIGKLGDLVAYLGEDRSYIATIKENFYRLTNKDMAYFRDRHTGELVTVVRQYGDASLNLIWLLRRDVIRMSVSLLATVVVLLQKNTAVGLSALAVVVAQAAYLKWSSSLGNKYRLASHKAYRELSGFIADVITNITAFKAGGNPTEEHKTLKRLSKAETIAFEGRRKLEAQLEIPRVILSSVGMCAAFYFVVKSQSNTNQSVELIVLTISYIFQINRNVSDIPDVMKSFDDNVTKMYAAAEVRQSVYENIRDQKDTDEPTHNNGAIVFSGVTFSYESKVAHAKKQVFVNLDLSIAAGEQIGIVGLSGAGKSTLASLLMRFDEVTSGTITIDGVDIKKMPQDKLHQLIAYIPQEPLLFHRSIRSNIAYQQNKATLQQIQAAAKAAHAHEFITELSEGYDTFVGERGVKLSGGQKQRVAIARAILKNTPIMLLDEATSALDSESEEIIQKALPQILGKRTAIVIAHRLSTIANLDRIIVLEDGKIIEQGTHSKLLASKGRYAMLWQKQSKSI